jgi:hypothetical protein
VREEERKKIEQVERELEKCILCIFNLNDYNERIQDIFSVTLITRM